MSIYAIGDVQGCYDDLMRLLEHIDYSPSDDTLWFAGDLVNRGPQSLQTLRFIHSLGDRAVVVLGNHDLHLLSVAWGATHQRQSDTFDDVLASDDCESLLHWLRVQPLLHYDPLHKCVMVHAGIYPAWSLDQARAHAREAERMLRGDDYGAFLKLAYGNTPLRFQDAQDEAARLRFITNSLTRMRYCHADGRLDFQNSGPLGSQPAGWQAWFELSDQLPQDVRVVFGHWSALAPFAHPRFYAMDSGCVWGGALSALCIETGVRAQVACRAACARKR